MDNEDSVVAQCGYLVSLKVNDRLRDSVPFNYYMGIEDTSGTRALVVIRDEEADLKGGRFRMLRSHTEMRYDIQVETAATPEFENILDILGEMEHEWAIGRVHHAKKNRVYTFCFPSELEAIDFKLRIP